MKPSDKNSVLTDNKYNAGDFTRFLLPTLNSKAKMTESDMQIFFKKIWKLLQNDRKPLGESW